MWYQADALMVLKTLPSTSVQSCVTSPPYYWQRDYGHEAQIGHEATPEAYCDALVAVFREVARTLHPTGTLSLNLGDTYYSARGRIHGRDDKSTARQWMRRGRAVDYAGFGIPPKSLLGMPWRVALALQTDGWVLRSDIIWQRANTLPEPSAHDRPWQQHEHVFLFAKQRHYYYDRLALCGEESVWHIPCRAKNGHSAAFPDALADRCILTTSRHGDTILDPFCGSGTTYRSAQRLGRVPIGIDLVYPSASEIMIRSVGATG